MMRGRELVGEARRNVLAGASGAIPAVLVMVALVVSALAVTLADVVRIGQRATAYRESGAPVLILRSPGRIDPAACESLNGSVSAGAVRRAAVDLVPSSTPGNPIPTYEVTPGLAAVVAPGARMAEGIWVSAEVAQRFGLGVGDVLEAEGSPRVGGVYRFPDDGRQQQLAFAVLLPVASGTPFDECWGATWPESDGLEALLRSTRIPQAAAGDDVAVSQLNGTLGRRFDAAAQYWERPTRYVGIACLAAAFVAQLVIVGLRRIELASARHSGVALPDLVAIVLLETLAWVLPCVSAGFTVYVWFARAAPESDLVALGSATWGGVVSAGLAGAVVAVLLNGERSLFGSLKHRR